MFKVINENNVLGFVLVKKGADDFTKVKEFISFFGKIEEDTKGCKVIDVSKYSKQRINNVFIVANKKVTRNDIENYLSSHIENCLLNMTNIVDFPTQLSLFA